MAHGHFHAGNISMGGWFVIAMIASGSIGFIGDIFPFKLAFWVFLVLLIASFFLD